MPIYLRFTSCWFYIAVSGGKRRPLGSGWGSGMGSISGDSWRLERNGERERIVSEVVL